jgi:lipoyl-dependent peroxiredoxin
MSMKILYTAKILVKGGRKGSVQSEDKRFRMAVRPPVEAGGDPEDKGTNPEELFAAAYGASFRGAMESAAKAARASLKECTLICNVQLRETHEGGHQLGVELQVNLPGIDHATAEKILESAHRTCPFSKAMRGNAEVKLTLGSTGRVRTKRALLSFGR